MFAFLRGIVAEIESDRLALDVGGAGYELLASRGTLSRLKKGQEALLYVHMNMAQDSLALYGFATKEERSMFRRLMGVSRVGPKVALSVLSTMAPADVAMAIVSGNDTALARTPGLGKKTAQRIILELKEKIATEESFGGGEGAAAQGFSPLADDIQQEAVTALVALGYDAGTAARAVKAVTEPAERVEDLLKAALRQLGRRA